jgi:RHS repeat-associated protein
VSSSRRFTAALTAYSLLLQLLVAGGFAVPAAAQTPPPMAPQALGRLAATASSSAYSVVLNALTTGFDGISGIAAYEPTNELAIAADTAGHDFELIAADGAHRPFSSANGLVSGARIATARGDGAFRAGELFAAAGNEIVRISADGASVQNAWATLPGETSITALTVDRTGSFGGDVIAVTAAGNVWRINASSTATRVASIGVPLGSVVTLANDPDRHGPWAGCIVAGAAQQPVLYAVTASGTVTPQQTSAVARDLAVVTPHENFFGIDSGDHKVWGAPADAFADIIGDVLVAQASPGILQRVHWNGTSFESAEVARVSQWQQIVFSPAALSEIKSAKKPYDRIAVVRHAPLVSSGRVEGALWQLAPESVTLDGNDAITSDLLVPGTPQVTVTGHPAFGGTIEGAGERTPSTHTVAITGSSTLGHLITRTDAMSLSAVAAFTPTTNTRDAVLTTATDSAGDFATLHDLTISGKAAPVTVPPGRYGRFSASGRTTFIFGVAGATAPAQYELDSLTLSGGSDLRVAGPVILTLNNGATLTGSTIGAAELPRQLIVRLAGGALRIDGKSVLYAIVRAPQSTVTIDGGGRLRGTLSCDRLDLSGALQLTDTDIPPPPVNRPPVADAGADAWLALPDSLTLRGAATDDGLPTGSTLTTTWSRVSGPSDASFSDVHSLSPAVTFTAPGTYVLRLTASDTLLASADDVTITVDPPNTAPVVNAGADQTIALPSTATLTGTATDDGYPRGSQLDVTWSGPSGVTFADAHAKTTTATFAAAGTYTLRLTATDGALTTFDEVVITVDPQNAAPVVNAGADQNIALPGTATLAGAATDDGYPRGSQLAITWSAPAGVTFADAHAVNTTATFAAAGTYTLRLTGTDGTLTTFDEAVITVDPQNAAPTVNAGADQIVELPAPATLAGTATDDGYPHGSQLSVTWSGPSSVVFVDPHAAATTATFAAAGLYTLRLTATDGTLTTSDDVVLDVRDPNQAPTVNAGADQTVRLPKTAALSATVNDDGRPSGAQLAITWSGPAGVTFADPHAASTTATFHAAGTYVLRITADDSKLQASDELTVTVLPANTAPAVSAGANQTVTLPAAATLQGTATDDGVPSPLTYAWTKVSGPADVTFATPAASATTATFTVAGTYVLRLTTSDSELSASADVTVVVNPGNAAPVVNAGPDQSIDFSQPAILTGGATDDGLPAGGALTYQWSVAGNAPGVTFSNATSATTTATFSAVGTYVLRLTVSDSALSGNDDVTIHVGHIPVADFTTAGNRRNVARFRNDVAYFGDGANVAAFTSQLDTNTAAALFAIDHNPYSRWRTATGQVANQSLTIALAGSGPRTIDRVRILNWNQSNEGIRNFRVQVSATTADDAAFTTVVTAVAAYHDRIQEFPFSAPVEARYVRLVAVDNYGGTGVSIRDLEVIGTGLAGIARYAYPNNLASSREGTTIVDASAWVRNPSQAIDENTTTFWYGAAASGSYFTLQLPQRALIDRVQVLNGEGTSAVKDVRIEIADTAAGPFTVAATATLNGTAANGYQDIVFPNGPVSAGVVKFVAASNYGASGTSIIVELRLVPPAGSRSAVSNYNNIWERPEWMFDNNSQTGWTTQSGHVSNESVVVRLDDADPTPIDRVALTSMTSSSESLKDFDILVSNTTDDDAAFTTVVSGTLVNDFRPHEFVFPGGPVRAKYVKLLAKNNYGGPSIEVSMFEIRTARSEGNLISAPLAAIALRNQSPAQAANGAKVVASSGGNADVLLDYIEGPPWITPARTNQFAIIQLGGTNAQTINGVRVGAWTGSISGGDQIRDFEVWVSSTTTDPPAFDKVLAATVPPATAMQDFFFPAVSARYVKYVPLSNGSALVNIVTGLFDVLQPVPAGGVVAGSAFNGGAFPQLATDGTNNGWIVNTATQPSLTLAMPDNATRLLYGMHFDTLSSSSAPKDYDVLVSTTTPDDAAFTLAYSGTINLSQRDFYFGRTFEAKYVKLIWKSGYGSVISITEMNLLTMTEDGAAPLGITDGITTSYLPNQLLDADVSNGLWLSGTTHATPEVIGVALPNGAVWRIDRVALLGRTDCGTPCDGAIVRQFDIQVSAGDGSDASYQTVYSGAMQPDHTIQYFTFKPVLARYVRFVLRNNYAGAGELQLLSAWAFSPQFGTQETRFVDMSSTAGANIVSYAWDFGDGATSSERDPQHTYAQPGTYDVSLTITDADGQTSRRTMPYHIVGAPAVDFTWSPAIGNEVAAVFFTDASTNNFGLFTSSNWSWGDNTTDTIYAATASHAWADNGIYNVTHTVTNGRGITATVTKPVTIANVPPTANAGADLTVAWGLDWGVLPSFSDVSASDRPTIRCSWDFGDGSTLDVPNCATAAAPKHSYATPGTYDARVTVTDKDGGVSSDVVRTTVTRRPSLVSYEGEHAVTINQPIALKALLREGITHERIANETVVFNVGGQTASAITSATGEAVTSLVYTGSSANPVISASFGGNTLYDASSLSFTVTCPAATQKLDVVVATDLVRNRTATQLNQLELAEIAFSDARRNGDQISIIAYGNPPKMLQTLTADTELARKAIDGFTIYGSGLMNAALDAARTELTSSRHSALAVPIAVVITDSQSYNTTAPAAATNLKATGTRLVVVYVGGVDTNMENNLRALASSPSDFYIARSYSDLLATLVNVEGAICHVANVAPVVDAGPDQTITAAKTTLAGTVTDDGIPPAGPTLLWSKVSGPGKVRFDAPATRLTSVSFDTRGTYVLRLTANDLQYATSDDVTITVDADIVNLPPVVNAGPDLFVSVPPVPPVPPLSLHTIRSDNNPVGIDYHQPTNKVVFSVDYPSGVPSNFALVGADGTRTNFSSVSGLTDELKIATARDEGNGMSRGGFQPGELFSGSGAPGVVIRISPDGKVVQNPWVVLPGETGLMRGSLYVDRTGVFGGDLIVVTTAGGVWRINAAGHPTQLARINTHLEGVTTVPNDSRYGPWAGKIIAGAENQTLIYSIDPQGRVTSYSLGIGPEDIDIIPPNENFFGVDYAQGIVLGAPAAAFSNWIGDFIIVVESGQMYHVWWDGAAFQKVLVAQTQHWEHVTFAPAGLGDIGPVGIAATLNGSVNDDGLPIDGVPAVGWTQVSGPAQISFNPSASAISQARFIVPGDYTLRLTANDGALTSTDDVVVRVSEGNHAPVVDAGPDQTIVYPSTSASLHGSSIDDGLPAGSTLTATWTTVSGPNGAVAAFADAHAANTTATFPAAGTYILRLTVNDTQFDGTDDVVITVTPAPINKAPLVDAGADIHFVNAQLSANLAGSVQDDGLPSGSTLSITWTKVSGPGNVTFATATAQSTQATFSVAGDYVVKLTASDGALSTSDTVAVHAFTGALTLTPSAAGPNVVGATQMMKAVLTDSAGSALFGETVTFSIEGANGRTFSTVTDTTGTAFFTYTGSNAGNDTVVATAGTAAVITSNPATVTWIVPSRTISATTIRARFFTSNGSGGFNATPDQPLIFEQYLPTINLNPPAGTVPGNVSGVDVLNRPMVDVTTDVGGNFTGIIIPRGNGASLGVDYLQDFNGVFTGSFNVASAGDITFKFWADDGFVFGVGNNASRVGGANVNPPASGVTGFEGYPIAGAYNTGTGADQPRLVTVHFPAPGSYPFEVDYAECCVQGLALTMGTTSAAGDSIIPPTISLAMSPYKFDAQPVGSTQSVDVRAFDAAGAPIASLPVDLRITGANAQTLHGTTDAGGHVTFQYTGTNSGGDLLQATSTVAGTTAISNEVTIDRGTNTAPVANAGTDRTINKPTFTTTLTGSYTDDGAPAAAPVSYLWTCTNCTTQSLIQSRHTLTTAITFGTNTTVGGYNFRLTVSDGALTSNDDVVVTLADPVPNQAPTVNAGADQTIYLPKNQVTLSATVADDGQPAPVTVSWTKVSGPGDVTFATPTSTTTTATFSAEGTYVVRITTTDSALSASDDVAITVNPAVPPPVAEITSPQSGATITDRTLFFGTVGAGAAWHLDYRLNGNDAAAADTPWRTLASGSGPLTNAPLGTFDPTVLLNGIYKVRLVATDASGQTTVATVSVVVDGHLKVGLFSLTFTDLQIPLPGMAIRVDRTYDSRDTSAGDFGHGWRLNMSNARVQKSRVLGTGWKEVVSSGPFPQYCIAATAPHLVAFVMPDGTTYRFTVEPSPKCQPLAPIQTPVMTFVPMAGTHASLEAEGENDVIVDGPIPGPMSLVTSDVQPYNPSTFRLTDERGNTYRINETAGVQQITDRDQNVITISRDGITHSAGRSVAFVRDSLGRITSITDAAGKSLRYAYDASGDLHSFSDQTSRTTTYTYDAEHHLIDYIDSMGRRGIRNEYDATGRLVATTDAGGHTTKFDYDPLTRREVVTDRRGQTIVYEYDAHGGVLKITDADGLSRTATYDDYGHVLTSTDKLGHTEKYEYDPLGNITKKTDAEGRVSLFEYNSFGQVLSVTDTDNHRTTMEYDTGGHLVKSTLADGSTMRFGYDAHGNLTTITDDQNHVRTMEYDAYGNVVKKTDPRGFFVRSTFDAMGNALTTTDAYGKITTFAYDAAGRLTSTTDPAGGVTKQEYDGAGQMSAHVDSRGNRTEVTSNAQTLPTSRKDADGTTLTLEYEPEDVLTKVTRSDGRVISSELTRTGDEKRVFVAPGVAITYELDDEGRRTAEIDPLGHKTTYELDNTGRQTAVVDALGERTQFQYNGAGQVTSIIDANHNEVKSAYDEMQRLVRSSFPDGSYFEYDYDTIGRMTTSRDILGAVRKFGYDDSDNLSRVTEPNDVVTSTEYDGNGNLTSITDGRGHVVKSIYDDLGRASTRTYVDGSAEHWTYEIGPAPKTFVNRAGQTTSFDYDARNRISTVHYADGTSVGLTYTPDDKLDVASGPAGAIDHDYDLRGNLLRATYSDGTIVSYTYDDANNRTSMTTPAGTTTYEYDAVNRLTKVTDQHGHVTRYGYDGIGNTRTVEYPNGLVTTRTFDGMNRVETTTTTKPDGTVLFGERYSYDSAGNRKEILSNDGSSILFTYDSLSRVDLETRLAADGTITRQIDYDYDEVGNRKGVTDLMSGVQSESTFDAMDQLVSDGTRTFAYDDNGNTRKIIDGTAVSQYTYDARAQLTRVDLPGGGVVTHDYDAKGDRVRTTSNGTVTELLHDPSELLGRVLLERDATKQVVADFVYGQEMISVDRDASEVYYIYDGMGSVRALADGTGTITDRYDYDAFGATLMHSGLSANEFLYRGERLDPATGLYHLHARDYDPRTGRFIERDALGGTVNDPRTLNRYVYALDNPVNRTDPSGHVSGGEGTIIHGIIGMWYARTCKCEPRLEWRLPRVPWLGVFAKKAGGLGLRPDLVDSYLGEVYEVKPLSPYGIAAARPEAAGYVLALTLLTFADFIQPTTTGFPWHLGFETFRDPPPEAVAGLWVKGHSWFGPGAVIYTEDPQRLRKLSPKDYLLAAAAMSAAFLVDLARWAGRGVVRVPAPVEAGGQMLARAQSLLMNLPELMQSQLRITINFLQDMFGMKAALNDPT